MYINVYIAKLLFSDFSFSVTTLSIYFYTDTSCAILLVILRINVHKKKGTVIPQGCFRSNDYALLSKDVKFAVLRRAVIRGRRVEFIPLRVFMDLSYLQQRRCVFLECITPIVTS